jgi:D-tyrosyl-tRNA(Tyr) deacylase
VRAVVQRVSSVCVRVAGREIARAGEGLLALIGVSREDVPADADELARRIVQLRIFETEAGAAERSLLDCGGTLCIVSQFTLYADARKGRRPAYTAAAPAEYAEPLVARVATAARALGVTVVTGSFGAAMDVELCNRGPFTILLDTEKRI